MDSPEFVLSTLHPVKDTDQKTDSATPLPYVPRARYCVFRGMWAELAEDERNAAPRNEHVYESDLLTFTTDVRMEKVPEVFATSPGRGDASRGQGSGGGGPIEAVFWAKAAHTQWRIKGELYVVGPDIEGSGEESSGVRTVKDKVGARMRVVKEEGKQGWSWKKEITGQFGNLAPMMRGSFKNPAPGTPVSIPLDDKRLGLGQKVTDLNDEVARQNFRVMIIVPERVEQIDLTDPAEGRRWAYTYIGPKGGDIDEQSGEKVMGDWKKIELWP